MEQHVALDDEVAHRLGGDRGQEDGLARHQVELAEEARRAVAHDLGCARGVEDRRLALEDRDERVALVADLVEDVTGRGSALLAEAREGGQLRPTRSLALLWSCCQAYGAAYPARFCAEHLELGRVQDVPWSEAVSQSVAFSGSLSCSPW